MAKINVALQAGGLDDDAYTAALYRWMFSPEDQRHIDAIGVPFKKCIVTPLHLRYTILALLRYGDRTGGMSIDTPDSLHRFARLLVFSLDLLAPDVPVAHEPGPEQFLGITLNQVNVGYFRSGRLLAEALLKAYLLGSLTDLHLDSQVEQTYGIDGVDFQTTMLSLALHFEKQDPLFLEHGLSTILDYQTHLKGTRSSEEIGKLILDTTAFILSDLPAHNAAFTMADLADRPLAYHDGGLCCLDLDFLTVRASRGRWNLATSTMDTRQRGVFGDRTGDLFQRYCRSLLAVASDARPSAWSAPEELLESAPADGLFVDGDYAVVFEFKSTPLPISAVYGADTAALGKAIDEKFVVGDGKSSYGFSQCANHLGTMLTDRKRFKLDKVRHIVPCLVLTEDVMTIYSAYAYAVLRATPLFESFGSLVNRPVILHFDDLLMLVERSKYRRLSHMVHRLSQANIITDQSVRNVILRLWPIEHVMAANQHVEVDHPKDLLDHALSRLDDGSEPMSQDCPTCGLPMRLVLGPPNVTWLCAPCRIKYTA